MYSQNAIVLAQKIKLSSMGVDTKRLTGFGGEGEAYFSLEGAIKNIKLTKRIEYNSVGGVKNMKMMVTADMNASAKLVGSGSVTLGYYSQAWREVEERRAKSNWAFSKNKRSKVKKIR